MARVENNVRYTTDFYHRPPPSPEISKHREIPGHSSVFTAMLFRPEDSATTRRRVFTSFCLFGQTVQKGHHFSYYKEFQVRRPCFVSIEHRLKAPVEFHFRKFDALLRLH